MKAFIRALLPLCSFLILASFFLLASCKPDHVTPTPKETERVGDLMKGNWTIQNVSIDGVTNNSFANMTLTFNSSSFSTTNGGVVWPATGNWNFKDESAKVITRSDGVEISVDAITASSFTLSFTWGKTTLGNGRGTSVKGKHSFTFKK